jgi:NAD-dependent dihydropyrimidine dehydrogenase PreA subunit
MKSDSGKVQVTAPYECVVLCSGCVKKCPQGAISFPRREDFEKYVIYED